jgi:hypothetical protein
MTPEERNLITELFDRLATLEDAQRDPEAERAIRDGLRQAPNAVYALVQTVLVQDEALKQADARIRELSGAGTPPRDTSFLGGMRETLFGGGGRENRGSVPSVRPGDAAGGTSSAWRNSAPPMGAPAMGAPAMGAPAAGAPAPEPMQAARPGGSFLGTAAAAAAGVIGGSLLLDSIRSMTGQRHGAFDQAAAGGSGGGSPWGGGSAAGGDLSRQAGLDDMGRASSAGGRDGTGDRRQGLLDDSNRDSVEGDDANADDENDFDFDDDDGGDSGDE